MNKEGKIDYNNCHNFVMNKEGKIDYNNCHNFVKMLGNNTYDDRSAKL